MKKPLVFLALLLSSSLTFGCRQENAPRPLTTGTLAADAHAARQEIVSGMSEAQVRSVLGKPTWGEQGSDSYQGTTTRRASLFYEYPAQKRDILIVHFKNGRLDEAKVTPYPLWARFPFPTASGTPKQVKASFGSPSLTTTTMRQGRKTVYWIYTDKVNSKKTLVVGFENGKVASCMLSPNREDWDNGKFDQRETP